MSFQRFYLVLKQISSSNSYSNVQCLIQDCFFDETLHLTAEEQEKLLRVCLKKLVDWFVETPEQIQQIKLNFHRYILQTRFLFKQKQLIDLILNQLKSHFNDYFLFLLTDFYEKHYSQLLDELAKDSDVGYLIHLPDRIANICQKNIPVSFQIQIYFHRLSEYIEEQLVTYHYPNMVAQIDTNINFLSQLIHKGAKLGYTKYLWRPLFKNVFLKKCPHDRLWLRLGQYFVLETIDDVLLYTIEHGNAKILDLFVSDRILHEKSLEIYLTETLLFRKQFSIDVIQSILIYLTMSSNRIDQCFQPVFIRLVQLWSQQTFIRFSSNVQHLSICQSICICLSLNKYFENICEKDKLIVCLLNGIRIHLESTFDYIRRRGQVIGELIVQRINVFSSSNQLQFDTYDQNHVEVKMLKKLAQPNDNADDRQLSDTENEQILSRKQTITIEPMKTICSTSIVVLREVSDDDDDVDSEFELYDYCCDVVKSDVPKVNYIRTCLSHLIATDQICQLESALHSLPSLIEMNQIECEEVAVELVRILLNYNSSFDIDKFNELQLNGLISLCTNYPLLISDYLCKQFYEKNYTIQQRSLILKTIEKTGRKLSEINELRNEIESELFICDDDDNNDQNENWRSTINQRLKLKSKYKRRNGVKKQIVFKENHFGNVVGHFFFPLIANIDQTFSHLSLIVGDEDHLLLCELVACLARLCVHAQNTHRLISMIKLFVQLLKSLQNHSDAGVRHVVIYAYACCLVSINSTCHDDEIRDNFIEMKQWLDSIILHDTNTEVHKLARTVRQILLRTLQQITAN